MRSPLSLAIRLLGAAALSACAALPAFAQSSALPTVILTTPPRWISEAPTHPYRYDYELSASHDICTRSKSFHCRFIPLNSKSTAQLAVDARSPRGMCCSLGIKPRLSTMARRLRSS